MKKLISIAVTVLIVMACGKNPDPTTPPPGAQLPNPVPAYAVGACGMSVAGLQPLHSGSADANYYGTLTDYVGNGRGNAITVNLLYYGTTAADLDSQNIVGVGSVLLPDLGVNTSTCMSSSDTTSLQPIPGNFVSIDKSIAIVLRGIVARPLAANSFSNYPGGYFQGGVAPAQEIMQVQIGYSCGAYIHAGARIYGCVDVSFSGYGDSYSLFAQ